MPASALRPLLLTCLLTLVACASAAAADDAPASDVYRDNVMIILDGSGSMQERMRDGTTRIDAAKRAIITVLESIPEDTAVGLVAFSRGKVGLLGDLGASRSSLARSVTNLREAGGTPLGEALKVAADGLLTARSQQLGYGTYTLLVVTDGEAGDTDKMVAYAPEIVTRGIRMDVIGVDMKQVHTLREYAHRYRSADDTASLSEAVASTFAEVGGSGSDAGSEDFELINEVFSVDSARAALGTLAVRDDHPIGTTPAAPEPEQAIAQPGPAPAPGNQPAPTPSTPVDMAEAAGGSNMIFVIAFGAFFFLILIGFFRAKAKG